MEQTECPETLAHKIQMLGNHPKKEYSSLEISVKFNKSYTSIINMEFSVTQTTHQSVSWNTKC